MDVNHLSVARLRPLSIVAVVTNPQESEHLKDATNECKSFGGSPNNVGRSLAARRSDKTVGKLTIPESFGNAPG